MSSIYSRISKRASCAMPSFSLKAAKSAFSMLPVAWMWRKFRFASSHTAKSATRSFNTCAPSEPPNETITTCPGCTPSARRAARTVCAEHLRAHWVAHHHCFFRRAQARYRVRHGGQHHAGVLCQYFVRHTRKGVLLVDSRGNTAPLGRLHHRAADIAARTYYKVRLHFVQNRGGARGAERQMIQRHCVSNYIFWREPPLDAIHLNRVKRVARLGDKAILHPLFAPGQNAPAPAGSAPLFRLQSPVRGLYVRQCRRRRLIPS